jgi:hypothetical protein
MAGMNIETSPSAMSLLWYPPVNPMTRLSAIASA